MTDTADWNFADFVAGKTELPPANLAWNTYGKGVEAMGKDGAPESQDLPIEPADDQLLIRCLLYTSPSPRDRQKSRMPSSA